MPDPAHVSAVLVTRGNEDMTEILDSIDDAGIRDVVVWNNALEEDLAVYGRYHAIGQARHDVIYVQDDDCVLTVGGIETLIAAYEPGVLVANMPPPFRHEFYADHCLVGFGAVFDRDLPEIAFIRWSPRGAPTGSEFYRTCDIVFSMLTPRKLVDVPYRNLPWATGDDRMYRQPEHVGERQRTRDLARKAFAP